MYVLIVEDDYLQAENLRSWLSEVWPRISIRTIQTELEFRTNIATLSADPPSIVIMDCMLRWCDPGPSIPQQPNEIQREGFYSAGLRCIDLLQETANLHHVPVILYTVLDRIDLGDKLQQFPHHVKFLHKAVNRDSLIQFVGSFLSAQKPVAHSSNEMRDVFICHASEDKQTVVEPLVNAIGNAGISFWYDQAEIQWGDSVVSKIEEGLKISRYVIAVLSRHSVGKPWPRRELNAALSREASSGVVRILPLIVGTSEERTKILLECSLQADKLYEVWNGSPATIVNRLKARLNVS
jgi:hypothetical protein